MGSLPLASLRLTLPQQTVLLQAGNEYALNHLSARLSIFERFPMHQKRRAAYFASSGTSK